MSRKIFMSCLLVLASTLFFFSMAARAQNQQTTKEEIAIVTYYPSPYGSFDTFQTNRMSVGDTNGDGQQTSQDLEANGTVIDNGHIYLARGAIYKPQVGSPADWAGGRTGEQVYSADKDSFYYYNGSKWVAQAGSGSAMYTLYGTTTCPAAQGWVPVYAGWALSATSGSGASGGGGIVCMQGDLPHKYPSGWVWWFQGNNHYTDTASDQRISCVVCVKQ